MKVGVTTDSSDISHTRAVELFLKVLRETCNVSEGCRAAGIARSTSYKWRGEDPEFAAAWDDAEEEATDALEKVARERAIDSSDRMLEILLKAHRPNKFKDRVQTEHTGKDGVPLADEIVSASERIIAKLNALSAAVQ